MKLFLFAALATLSSVIAHADTQTIQEDAVEINGAKFWFPSEIIVKKGDTVKIHLTNKVPGAGSTHGFAIDAFKIAEVVDAAPKGKDVEFVADKAGIFPIRCQLHPAHVGGQLVVLDN